ncbi:hypothetical protein [Corallincola spongiicola]|uniref:CASP-like protein n=1 Tax=Corallincola spongiicola TaxID=2520508 RepID=A0ABY1WN87_9GAMM|nr:hypothetical protein [Corallincola spongiicola]TAA45026.1 hypothetical protein EXY25_12520 [Corallincola spongiicola]
MKFYPYNHVSTDNFKWLLLFARVICVLGVTGVLIQLFFSTHTAFFAPTDYLVTGDANNLNMQPRGHGHGLKAYLQNLGFIFSCISLIFISGVIATLVSIESKVSGFSQKNI